MKILGQEKSGTTFYCFSPLVMITTFLVELILMIYVIYRYKLDIKGRLIALLLIMLAIFQLCEYMISSNYGDANSWSKIGFVAITLLPALGLHLVSSIGRPNYELAVKGSYAAAAVVSAYFVLVPGSLESYYAGNYIIFNIPESYNVAYGTYYYGLIAAYLYMARHKMSRSGLKRSDKLGLGGFSIGTLTFLIPTIIVAGLKPETQAAIPSIMCGFALIFAFVLAIKVAPAVLKLR